MTLLICICRKHAPRSHTHFNKYIPSTLIRRHPPAARTTGPYAALVVQSSLNKSPPCVTFSPNARQPAPVSSPKQHSGSHHAASLPAASHVRLEERFDDWRCGVRNPCFTWLFETRFVPRLYVRVYLYVLGCSAIMALETGSVLT